MGLTNGKERVSIYVLSFILAGVVGFFSGQIVVTRELGDRPTREELDKTHEKIQHGIQRELDDIKRGQDRAYDAIQELNKNVNEILRSQRKTNRDR